MIDFIIISIFICFTIFYFMYKIPMHNAFKIILLSFFTGGYLNIADNGNMVKWLSIQLTDDIIYVSLAIVFIYMITMFILFREPYDE